ncbi:glutamate 5-kinase [Mucilaginibacter terrae]|uniref:Glutamate 5-kinase n=1 Tax=Mucilaginibacter terrae TaxID=1955052 RepID=A0ABU3GRU5_9SPHI|nr:glutamate 5-kinase [Mucilaginibacter terrae]MDT3402201.1 glutamate 5-kinase [Mucilaginibacter terrae]
MNSSYQRIVIKVGSNVLTQANGLPDAHRIANLVDQIASIQASGKEVILVSSGAVASGRSLISLPEKVDPIATRQLLASVGQVKLINTYAQLLEKYNMVCSQVLVTREDFRDKTHYQNMKNCLDILLKHKVLPIVNENDVVSVTELMFTDNDELAGLIASMLNAQALIILSNVDGIFDGDPKLPGSKLIEEITHDGLDFSSFISSTVKSQFGRGGMITKSTMAQKVARLGINVHIANGTKDGILNLILNGKDKHTRFIPKKSASSKKKWIAHSGNFATGMVTINEGAKTALTSARATSLLPVGVVKIDTEFKKGDIIRIMDEKQNLIGQGIAEYGADKARERLGKKNEKALVHYDYLYLQA